MSTHTHTHGSCTLHFSSFPHFSSCEDSTCKRKAIEDSLTRTSSSSHKHHQAYESVEHQMASSRAERAPRIDTSQRSAHLLTTLKKALKALLLEIM